MDVCVDEVCLSTEERVQASAYWDALVLTTHAVERDHASLEMMQASPAVQHAVMSSINSFWMQEREPQRDDNPFYTAFQQAEISTVVSSPSSRTRER